jgi:hypothetical protein
MESQQLFAESAHPYAKVFEFVPGARLQGRTAPDTRVGLSLAVHTNRGRKFQYRDRMKSGPDGSFEFVVAYANSDGPDWLKVDPRYAIHCGVARGWATVSEAQIRAGESIWVGDPCADAPVPARKRNRRRPR